MRVWGHLRGHLSYPKVLWGKLRLEDMFGQKRVVRFHSPDKASRNRSEESGPLMGTLRQRWKVTTMSCVCSPAHRCSTCYFRLCFLTVGQTHKTGGIMGKQDTSSEGSATPESVWGVREHFSRLRIKDKRRHAELWVQHGQRLEGETTQCAT